MLAACLPQSTWASISIVVMHNKQLLRMDFQNWVGRLK